MFEQRLYHVVGPHRASFSRESVFMGYAYRWIQLMDYIVAPSRLLDLATPIQRQLLGETKTQVGFYLPTDDDVPLRCWAKERETKRNP